MNPNNDRMKLFLVFFILGLGLGSAQYTLQLPEGESSPPARLEDVAWIQGHWRGEAFGGTAEEIWGPPLGGSMMFVFKLAKEGEVTFYEVGHILKVGPSILMQLKHFDGNLRGWEQRDQTVDFRLVRLERDKVYFEGMTMERVGRDRMNVYVLIEEEGNSEEVLISYTRVP